VVGYKVGCRSTANRQQYGINEPIGQAVLVNDKPDYLIPAKSTITFFVTNTKQQTKLKLLYSSKVYFLNL